MQYKENVTEVSVMVLAKAHNYWAWFLALGMTLLAMGSLTLLLVPLLYEQSLGASGAILISAGILQLLHALVTHPRGTACNGLIGLFYGYAGLLLIKNQAVNMSGLFYLLGALFFAWGALKIVLASQTREYPARSYLGLNAFVSIIIGIFLITQWPCAASWVIGTFVGIDLITDGLSWIAVGRQEGKRLPPVKTKLPPLRAA